MLKGVSAFYYNFEVLYHSTTINIPDECLEKVPSKLYYESFVSAIRAILHIFSFFLVLSGKPAPDSPNSAPVVHLFTRANQNFITFATPIQNPSYSQKEVYF